MHNNPIRSIELHGFPHSLHLITQLRLHFHSPLSLLQNSTPHHQGTRRRVQGESMGKTRVFGRNSRTRLVDETERGRGVKVTGLVFSRLFDFSLETSWPMGLVCGFSYLSQQPISPLTAPHSFLSPTAHSRNYHGITFFPMNFLQFPLFYDSPIDPLHFLLRFAGSLQLLFNSLLSHSSFFLFQLTIGTSSHYNFTRR